MPACNLKISDIQIFWHTINYIYSQHVSIWLLLTYAVFGNQTGREMVLKRGLVTPISQLTGLHSSFFDSFFLSIINSHTDTDIINITKPVWMVELIASKTMQLTSQLNNCNVISLAPSHLRKIK